jgi:Leucine rich repeat
MDLLHVVLVVVQFTQLALAACPSGCTCDRDSSTRKRVRCDRGDLVIPGTFSPQNIDKDTDVLYISAPAEKLNKINSLTPAMFKDLKLQELHILNSQLQSIGDRTFFYLSGTLRVLNLAQNSLVDINENNFRNLSGLTHLHLDHNRIIHIHSATFNYQRSLRVLTLSNNRIHDLGTRFLLQEFPSLEVCHLNHNKLNPFRGRGVASWKNDPSGLTATITPNNPSID